jgi:hypothetical protein
MMAGDGSGDGSGSITIKMSVMENGLHTTSGANMH